jgi:probable rRNA maturation factor
VNVFVANEQDLTVDENRAGDLARHVLTSEEVEDEAELSLLLVSPDHMQRLNARYAGNDYATDVLAFPLMEEEDDGELLLGDVVICPVVANRNAEKLGHPLTSEIDTLVVHGTLHLLGYDHQNDEDRGRMDERMQDILGSFKSAS